MVNCRTRIRKALLEIVKNHELASLTWAVDYARIGILQIDGGEPDSTLETQLIYVLGNISRWRGDTATVVRGTLKEALAALRSGNCN